MTYHYPIVSILEAKAEELGGKLNREAIISFLSSGEYKTTNFVAKGVQIVYKKVQGAKRLVVELA